MPVKRFRFYEKPDIRLVVLQNTVFKIKLTCQHAESRSIRKLCRTTKGQEEIERVVCGTLYHQIEDPILTDSFTIYPYKKKWPTAKKLIFKYKGKPMQVNYSMFTFYVEPRNSKKDEDEQKRKVTEIRQSQRRKIHDNVNSTDNEESCCDHSPVGQRTVTDYGQKNRHDIETQNLTEQLRMQEMAQPTAKEEKEEAATNEEFSTSGGLMSSLKKFFGR